MANEKNLEKGKATQFKSGEKAVTSGRKGGIASGKAKRERKSMKNTMKMLLSLDLEEENEKEVLKKMGIEENELNIQTAILTKQVESALKGSLDSAKFVRDTVGEYIGAEEEETAQEPYKVTIPAKDIPPAFINVYRDILNRNHLEYWLEGGRGSIKSTFANEVAIDLLENNPRMCAIIIRRYTNTLKDSVYSQTEWTISQFSETYEGLQDTYNFKTSPMEITKKSTGQKIYFRGTDDPRKNKINKAT